MKRQDKVGTSWNISESEPISLSTHTQKHIENVDRGNKTSGCVWNLHRKLWDSFSFFSLWNFRQFCYFILVFFICKSSATRLVFPWPSITPKSIRFSKIYNIIYIVCDHPKYSQYSMRRWMCWCVSNESFPSQWQSSVCLQYKYLGSCKNSNAVGNMCVSSLLHSSFSF